MYLHWKIYYAKLEKYGSRKEDYGEKQAQFNSLWLCP